MTDQPLDPYIVLGLSPQATQQQLSHAYRTLLRRHHPDTRDRQNPALDAAADAALQQVLAAYTVLHDPDSRASHDHNDAPQRRTQQPQQQAGSVRLPPRWTTPPIRVGPVRWHP